MKLYFFITIVWISVSGFSQDNWTLIYENDANGTTLYGNLDNFISKIQNGETVRIYYNSMRPGNSDTYVEHTALVKFFTIMNGPKGKFVTAQIDPIVGQVPNFKEEEVVLKENLEWSLIASTTGKNDTMTRNVITGEIVNHEMRRWGTKWFIRKK